MQQFAVQRDKQRNARCSGKRSSRCFYFSTFFLFIFFFFSFKRVKNWRVTKKYLCILGRKEVYFELSWGWRTLEERKNKKIKKKGKNNRNFTRRYTNICFSMSGKLLMKLSFKRRIYTKKARVNFECQRKKIKFFLKTVISCVWVYALFHI